ncbi:MAG TPA: type IV toxin-antitoxin system AbiEi family antitoxin domain-containing protein [Propionibacteriaceae bacterium]|nr:type IV toxin-antitoxin system AbiEi family antitoxin domain-containing protein [Propionibacteriaceae bacterium]
MSTVRLSRDLAEQGYTYAELARMTRHAELVRVRRGTYVAASEQAIDPRVAHLQLLEATAAQSSSDLVVSHASAAVLHGLPVGNDQLDRVHLTQHRHGQGRIRRYVHLHGAALGADDVTEVNGFRVTGLSRTVLDLSCALRPLLAVPIGDAALRAGMTTDELAQRLPESHHRHGIARARRTATLLDPRSESPGESMSRVVFAEHRIALPIPQLEVFDGLGRFVGRCDFGWEEERTLGEFDGKQKYGRLLLRPGQSPEDALFEEKQREDRLRDLGWQIVRWVGDERRRRRAGISRSVDGSGGSPSLRGRMVASRDVGAGHRLSEGGQADAPV